MLVFSTQYGFNIWESSENAAAKKNPAVNSQPVKILLTPESEYFVVMALFGLEYAINLGGPEIDGYTNWLKHNMNRSPLYPETATA